MKINKFNISWQMTRLRARNEKTIEKKIAIVKEYLRNNKNVFDFNRALNWSHMTILWYKEDKREVFYEFEEWMYDYTDSLKEEDNTSKFEDYTHEELILLLWDLSRRKYNFQYNKVPLDHVEFIKKLTSYLWV